jgi:hypothetical protein
MTYEAWAARNPQAAYELQAIQLQGVLPPAHDEVGKSEDWAQAQVRMAAPRAGGVLWRNNVGARKTKETHVCPACRFKFEVLIPPMRWGLCNDSAKLNAVHKSSDLIGFRSVIISPDMVGQTFAQFAAVEMKAPGWHWKGDAHEQAQAAYGSIIQRGGGLFAFSTGKLPW